VWLQAFGRAIAKQLLQSVLMGGVCLLAMYLGGQTMPWQAGIKEQERLPKDS